MRSVASSRRRRCCCGRSRTGCRARTASGPRAISRPRSSGPRTGGSRPRDYRAAARRPRAADPGRPDVEGLRRLRGAQVGAGRDRLRGPARAHGAAVTRPTRTPLPTFRDRYRAFTVDEYQDVNLLQQTLLERWLGDRDDLCVVGDDYQSIYGFTGASAEHLLALRGAGAGRSGSRRTTARRRRCSRSRTGSCPGSAAPRSSCARPARTAPSRRSSASTTRVRRARSSCGASASCTRRGSRSRRSRCCSAPTRARPTTRRCCTGRGSRSRAPRCSRATRRAAC